MPDFGFDDWMDAQLRNVPVPPELLSALADGAREAPRNLADLDRQTEASPQAIAFPLHSDFRLRRSKRLRRPRPVWQSLSLAASLFLALGLSGWAYVTFSPQRVPIKSHGVAEKSRPVDAPRMRGAGDASSGLAGPEILAVSSHADEEPASVVESSDSPSNFPFPTWQDVATMGGTLKQAMDQARSQATLGAVGNLTPLPELDTLELSAERGVRPPLVRGYDLLFQLKYGEHPFVVPSSAEALVASRVPFTFVTAGYDLALRASRAGRLPSPDEVRVEEFLAAQDYLLPPVSASGLGLASALCQSPLGDTGLHLMQLSVYAGVKPPRHRPARLVVAIEGSKGMRAGARWESALRALAQLAERMSPDDRLTLIRFNEQPHVLCEHATANEVRKLLAAPLPAPAGTANYSLALSAATQAATLRDAPATGMTLIASGPAELARLDLERLSAALEKLNARSTSWQVVCLQAGDGAVWKELAEASRGASHAAASSAELGQALVSQLIGRSTVVANNVGLKIVFNPTAVTGYRLLGHEATTLTAAASDPLEVDFHLGQTATNVYELWIKPGATDQIATAELTWTDPAGGQARRTARVVRSADVLWSFSQAPPWFQQGVMAAKTAEVLRNSYYAPAVHPAAKVRALAEQVDPRLVEQDGFRELLLLLGQAEKSR